MQSLRLATIEVLLTADADRKADAARALFARWQAGEIDHARAGPNMPARPARPEQPRLLSPGAMPKRGKAGSARSRFALLHALAHIELNAIDLAVDMAGRWGAAMPPAFAGDWLKVADDEARHFGLLQGLLRASGGQYGDLPAHDGLWEAAALTSDHLEARLAIVPMVLEARGLDVTPAMISRFEDMGDEAAANVLKVILTDEITHVKTGNRWFRHLCFESKTDAPTRFRTLVKRYFKAMVKPPFNDSAREKAGLTKDWYADLGTAVIGTKTSSTAMTKRNSAPKRDQSQH